MNNVIENNNPPIYDGQEDFIFISYSHKDKDLVYEDLWGLYQRGLHFWYDDGINAGEQWNETVEEKIKSSHCKLVIFFFSGNMLASPAIRKEMKLVKDFNKQFFTVNLFNDDMSELLGQALAQKTIKLSDMTMYTDFFNEDIIFIPRCRPDYIDNIAKQCIQHGLKAAIEVVNVKKNTKKILIVCKNSSFSNSIISGIYDYLLKSENIIADKKLIDRSLNRVESTISFNEILKDNIDAYDGFIVRTPEKYNDQTIACIQRILAAGKKIVLLDVEISSDKLKYLQAEPSYVGSDFSMGGAILGERIGEVANKFGVGETAVILFEGPYANLSTKTRCDSLISRLTEVAPTANIMRYNLPSLNATVALEYIKTQAAEWKAHEALANKNVILFCGIDNIAVEAMRSLTKNEDILSDSLRKVKSLVIVGYDGIRDANNEIILKNYGIDFITVDVIPFKQGVEAGKKIYSMLFEGQSDGKIYVQPELIEYVKFKSEKYDNAKDIQFILKNKKAFIFDLDGTIAETESLHWEAYNRLLKEYNVHLEPEHIKNYIGHAEMLIYDMIKRDFGIEFDNNEFFEKRISSYLELVEQKGLCPYEFIYDIVKSNRNIKNALVTSQAPLIADRLLTLWGLDEYFPERYRFYCHDGKYNKREVYDNISLYLDFSYKLNPNNIVLFEDAQHYLKEGQALGFTTIGVEHKYNRGSLKNCNAILTANVANGVFIGLCGLDAVYYGLQDMPPENTKTTVRDFSLEVGGPAANAAIAYAKLGGEAYLITAIGNNEEGLLLKSKLKALNVNVIDIIDESKSSKCNVSFIYVNLKNGSRTVFSGQGEHFISPNIDWGDLVKKAKFILYDGNLPNAENKLIQHVEYYDKKLVIDAGSYKPGFHECFYRADAVISSESFVDPRNADVFALQKKYGFKYAARTRGDKPVEYSDGDEIKTIGIPQVKAIDTLGAGDIFHGAFCFYRYAQELSFEQSLGKASEIATNSVTQKGVSKGVDYALKNILSDGDK